MSVNIKDSSLPAGYRPIAGLGTSDIRKYTTAEWDALTEDQLDAIPEGALVHITDDSVSNICGTVADCITSDNPDDVAGASALTELSNNLIAKGTMTFLTESTTLESSIDLSSFMNSGYSAFYIEIIGMATEEDFYRGADYYIPRGVFDVCHEEYKGRCYYRGNEQAVGSVLASIIIGGDYNLTYWHGNMAQKTLATPMKCRVYGIK